MQISAVEVVGIILYLFMCFVLGGQDSNAPLQKNWNEQQQQQQP